MPSLFSSYEMRGRAIRNRVVKAPTVYFCGGATTDGSMSERDAAHYEAPAKGGAGLIIVEAACVSAAGRLAACQPGIWSDSFIPGLSRVASVIRENGAVALIQIHHAGLRSYASPAGVPLAPSDYYANDKQQGKEMTQREIEETVGLFAAAAARAKAAGFDGVEVHGCHGYLINQFLSPLVNRRTDVYGEDKAKFGADIIKRLRETVGEDFIVGIRTPGNDPDFDTGVGYARAFVEAGADYLHVSTGFTNKKPEDLLFSEGSPNNWIAQLGIELKKHVSAPVIAVNGIKTPEQAKAVIEAGADFAAVGRAMLVDTEWVNKAARGETAVPCLGCSKCMRFMDDGKCAATLKGHN